MALFISKKTMYEFSEHLVARKVLREIEVAFDDADIPKHPGEGIELPSGQRRGLIALYYASLDLTKWTDAEKLLRVYEGVLDHACEFEPEQFERLLKWLQKDGFVWKHGRLDRAVGLPGLPAVKETSTKFDADQLALTVARIEASVHDDPALAIGSAKELVETTCRTILHERGVEADKDWDVQRLVRQTATKLNLTPKEISEAAKGAETIRRVLGSLSAIAQGLAELRNAYGTGHGKEGHAKGLTARHAKLAAGSAITLAVFLFDTHEERDAGAVANRAPG